MPRNLASVDAVPTLTGVSPAYGRALEQQEKLEKLRRHNLLQCDQARAALSKVEDAMRAREEHESEKQRRRVGKLLGLEEPAEEPRPPPDVLVNARKVLADAEAELADIDIALEINAQRLTEEHFEASLAVNEQLDPQMRALAKDVCSTLIALHGAVLRYQETLDRIAANDVRFVKIVPLAFRACGSPSDRYSAFAEYLHLCCSEGVIEKSDIPAQLKINGKAN